MDTSRNSDTIDSGRVITTEPAAGSKVKVGDTVTLFVSQGSDEPDEAVSYVVPWKLYGYTKERATEALEMQDLIPEYEYASSSEVGEGLVISTGPDSVGDGNIVIQDNATGTWKCNASLDTPTGYNGQPVRITLVQNGTEKTIFEGTTSFPYKLQVEGTPGVTDGTAYVYLLDPSTGEVASTIEYAGISFSQVN